MKKCWATRRSLRTFPALTWKQRGKITELQSYRVCVAVVPDCHRCGATTRLLCSANAATTPLPPVCQKGTVFPILFRHPSLIPIIPSFPSPIKPFDTRQPDAQRSGRCGAGCPPEGRKSRIRTSEQKRPKKDSEQLTRSVCRQSRSGKILHHFYGCVHLLKPSIINIKFTDC